VYVRNVSFRLREDDLQQLFSVAWIAFVRDRESGRSQGFAFVEMSSPAKAHKAISMFHSFSLADRQPGVNRPPRREG
jgi:RNA recognition motif-containing protein